MMKENNKNTLQVFFDKFYVPSIQLKKRFLVTEKKAWDGLTVLNELCVQIGHVATIVNSSKLLENGRRIDNLGDEVSDILLQLMIYIYIEKMDDFKIKDINVKEYELTDLLVPFGQLNEIAMEEYGYKFEKPREGFATSREFVIEKVNQMFYIILNFCHNNGIDINYEYQAMLNDANRFLDRYEQKQN